MASDAATHPLPPGQRLIVTVAVMAATIMQVLDTTIANVALPHMQAALGANHETVAWVLTSYIVASAIATPVTGWLSQKFGRKALTVTAIVGFTLASGACGLAANLETMIVARVVQGVFGAFIVPIAQAVMLDINPREKHAQAMTIWGMGVMIAPVIGPVLGGWITDQLDWRWVFYINIPVGLVALAGTLAAMPGGRGRPARFDIFGFVMLALGIASLQLMLDRGAQLDWFDSTEILVEAGLGIAALWVFGVHLLTAPAPLLPRAVFRDRNFVAALIVLTISSGVMIGGSALMPSMLQQLLGHDATGAGLITAPRGVGMMISMMLAGRVAQVVDGRLLIVGGLAVSAVALWMMTGFDLAMDSRLIIWSGLVQGLGFGFVVLPLNLLAFATLAPTLRTEAASLYSLGRTIGGSIMISIGTFLLAHNLQASHADLASHISDQTLPLLSNPTIQALGMSSGQALSMLDLEINRQALMIAYIDDFQLMLWATLICLPLPFLMRRVRHKPSADDVPAAME